MLPLDVRTATSTALLEGLKDPQNQTVWGEYVARHRPLILGYCARLDIGAADAEDIAQDALLAFAEAYRSGRYDRARGRLRGWLRGIADNAVKRWRRTKQRRRELQPEHASGLLARVADDRELAGLWDAEWQRSVVGAALAIAQREFEPTTFAAFEQLACRERAADEVARELGITRNAVYIAKHRVLQRLRELQRDVEQLWE